MFDVFADLAYQFVSLISPAVGAAGAIVVATLLLRFLLLPVARLQQRAVERRAARVRGLETTDADAAQLLRARSSGALAAALPMLVQLPIVAGLYRLATSATIAGHTNLLLRNTLFGAPLGAHLTQLAGPQLLVFGALVALLVAIGYATSRLLRPTGPAPSGVVGFVGRLAPYGSAVTVLFLPVAAALYLATTTACTLAQTVLLRQL